MAFFDADRATDRLAAGMAVFSPVRGFRRRQNQ